jgi:hypothetical protein
MAKRPTTKYSSRMRTRATMHGVMSGVGAGAAVLGTIGAGVNFVIGDVPGGLIFTAGAAWGAQLAGEAADKRRLARAKAFMAERGALQRLQGIGPQTSIAPPVGVGSTPTAPGRAGFALNVRAAAGAYLNQAAAQRASQTKVLTAPRVASAAAPSSGNGMVSEYTRRDGTRVTGYRRA